MTPEEAGNFHEDDEDPQEILARFDAAQRITAAKQVRRGIDYICQRYGDNDPAAWSYGA